MAVRGVLYRVLPSYRFQLRLREWGTGDFWQMPSVSGHRQGGGSGDKGVFHIIGTALDRGFPREPVNDIYFRKLLGLCNDRGLDFIYIPAPMSTGESELRILYRNNDVPFLRKLQEAEARFYFCDDLYAEYPPGDFCDGTHLNRGPLVFHRDKVIHGRLDSVLGKRYSKVNGVPEWL
jgi:hypothetical protein